MGMKKSAMIAAAAASALLVGRMASADTITLHDLSENISTGVFTYTVQLDSAANVAHTDGFVLYDFPDLTSWSIAGGFTDGSASPTGEFTLSQTLTSNVLDQSSSVDANGFVAALSNSIAFDNPSVPNLSFSYNGPPTPFLGATTAILTLTSGLVGGVIGNSVYASVDHSGPTTSTPYSFSANPILVPTLATPVPVPSALLGGLALFGLVGVRRIVKARRIMA